MTCTLHHRQSGPLSSLIGNGVCAALLCIASLVAVPGQGQAAESGTPTLSPAFATETGSSSFEYLFENRADPFVPFISEKAATSAVNMDEIVENNEPLTGMQLFEPGQLTLVALMKSGSEDMAMVEDFTGKGYVLLEGVKIGRRGMIKDITANSVIIEETAVTRAGKEIITQLVMTLKKEGEE